VYQVGNQYIVNSWCTVRKTSSHQILFSHKFINTVCYPTCFYP